MRNRSYTVGLTDSLATASPVVVHFNPALGQLPENIALAPFGTAYVTFALARQVAAVSPDGSIQVLATLPAPADGGVNTPVLHFPLTSGIVRNHDGTLYVLYATGTAELTGVWRLAPGGTPERIAALPANGLPNGLALDPLTGTLYIADSALGRIWRVPIAGGTPTVWSAAPELAATGLLGVNGLKFRQGAVWATNTDQGTVLRIPVGGNGGAGAVEVKATGLAGIDDFTFIGSSNAILAAINAFNTVELIQADGSHSVVLTAADGLQNPTSVAMHYSTVYVTSAAFATGQDPNLLLVFFGHLFGQMGGWNLLPSWAQNFAALSD